MKNDSFKIVGGNKLFGEIVNQTSKNATLPIMSACLLSAGDSVIKEYVKTEVKETITEKTKIKIVGDESDVDVDLFIKDYDVNYSDTGDFTINVYKGQDNYEIETITKTNNHIDVSTIIKIGIISLMVIIAIVIMFIIFSGVSSANKKIKRSGYYGKKKSVF